MDFYGKRFPVDWDVWYYDSDLNSEELSEYAQAICEALTANGNIGIVSTGYGAIAFCGNDGGDKEQLKKLLEELAERGCYVEEVVYEE